jgi:hypothetical protein
MPFFRHGGRRRAVVFEREVESNESNRYVSSTRKMSQNAPLARGTCQEASQLVLSLFICRHLFIFDFLYTLFV